MTDWVPPDKPIAWAPPDKPVGAGAAPKSSAQEGPPAPAYSDLINPLNTAIAPVANTLAIDPVRALAADVVGGIRAVPDVVGAVRGTPGSHPADAFYRERERSLKESSGLRIPETGMGRGLSNALGLPGQLISAGASGLSRAVLGDKATDAIGPFATVIGDALPFAGARVAGDIGTVIRDNRAAAAEKFVQNAYEKAIRPTVVGRRTSAQVERADQNVVSALNSIIDNKATLRLADKNGKEVIGRTPQTLDEFVQAIGQAKRPVFDHYDALARQAEGMGVKIDPTPAIAELRKFAADPSFNLPKYEGMRDYATKTADALASGGPLPPTVAQSMVRNLNEGLTDFYRKSSPEAASRAAVDDLVANQLRQGLDGALEKAGLPGYQEAKNAYGALKSIEGEVTHRAVVFGRRDPAGGLFGRLGSIASYEELARFATSFDPGALASAAAIKGGRSLTEYLHSPNRAVKKMFETAERYRQPQAPRLAPPFVQTGPQPPQPTGPGQQMYTGPQTPQGALQGRSGVTQPAPITPQPLGVRPAPIDPFNPPLGGRVSMIHPDDPLARALYG